MASSYNKVEAINEEKICERCGKKFIVTTIVQLRMRKYCSDACRIAVSNDKKAAKREYMKKYYETYVKAGKKAKDKNDIDMGPILSPEQVTADLHKEKKKKEGDKLAEAAVAARNAGESYGKYTSRDYAPTVIIPPNWARRYL